MRQGGIMNSISDQLRRSAEFRVAGHWRDDTLVTLIDRWADADPSHPYISDGIGELTYGEFRAQAWNLAAALAERGVKPGDRVAVQLPNWNEFFLIYAACARLGAVMIPIVVVYRAGEVGFIVENSGAVALITCGEFRRFDHAAMAREVAASSGSLLFRVVVRGEPADGALSFAELLGADCDASVLPGLPSADDPHLILYTSGTESRPKGCLHTWNSSSFLPKHAVSALKMDRTDVMFMPAPVTHALGLTLGVMAPTLAGASVHVLDVFDPVTALQRIGKYQCTGTASPAPFIRMLLDAYDPMAHDVTRLRFWLTAGAAIPAALVDEATNTFGGCRVVSAYGRPVPGVEIRIVGEDGRPAAVGVDGEIRYRGPGRLLEYWRRPDLTAQATDDEGWWCTGDVGRLDEDGYLRVTGRIKDIIIRGGFNISAREVEEALLAHPKIANVALVGIPDPVVGERACAAIVTRGPIDITIDELRDHLTNQSKLAIWKVPERVEFLSEMPVTATGKIQKFVLREGSGPPGDR